VLESTQVDVCIVGAGAAGLFCSSRIARGGKSVALLEHNKSAGRKILISGGGRCNFTNIHFEFNDFKSENPHFFKSALKRFSAEDFLELVKSADIAFYEKKLGQMFCVDSAKQILNMLLEEAKEAGVDLVFEASKLEVKQSEQGGFVLKDSFNRSWSCKTLVVATGGLSIPKIGASGWGYELAKNFGHSIVPLKPALVSFRLPDFSALSGLSLMARLTTGEFSVCEDLLLTHTGLSGPAALKASLYWESGATLIVDFLPEKDLPETIEQERRNSPKTNLFKLLSSFFPQRLAEFFLNRAQVSALQSVAELSKDKLRALSDQIHRMQLVPEALDGYKKAEVTSGGVSTKELSSKTMESALVPGLFFIGEVVDVTGQLGGFNFQWAWSSAAAAAQAIVEE